MKNVMQFTKERLLNFFFPPICITCKKILEQGYFTLCKDCFESLKFLSPDLRCPVCFSPLIDFPCKRNHFTQLDRLAACFDESLITQRLLSRLRYDPIDVACLMIQHWAQLEWPIPDCVIPTPGDWICQQSWHARQLIAKTLAALWQKPYLPILRINRRFFFKKYDLLEAQPKTISPQAVFLKSSASIMNKTVLLLHDRYETGETLHRSAHVLHAHGARFIMGYSFVAAAHSSLVE